MKPHHHSRNRRHTDRRVSWEPEPEDAIPDSVWWDPQDSATEIIGVTAVSELMTRDVICAGYDMSVETLTGLLIDKGVTGAPVLEDGKLIGFVSLADIVRDRYLAGDALTDPPERMEALARRGIRFDVGAGYHPVDVPRCVFEIMSPRPLAIGEAMPVAEAAALMASKCLRQVPVVTGDRVVVGILSAIDVLRWLAQQNGFLVERQDPDRRY
jgi:CBS domain-containing protein